MFGWLKKDPTRALQKAYEQKQKEARDAQRGGDIPRFAKLTKEADALFEELEQAKREAANG